LKVPRTQPFNPLLLPKSVARPILTITAPCYVSAITLSGRLNSVLPTIEEPAAPQAHSFGMLIRIWKIHAPHGQVQSFRDVAVHLAIVTVGILIALGLEQAVEWYHHRELADEARRTILRELRNNKNMLDRQLNNFPKFRADAVKAFHFISDYKNHGKTNIQWTGAFYYSAPLRTTSWSTAQTVGGSPICPIAK
jgi:hypothetical protein